jgi:tetratricopeptide (TPR) repeat protein
LATALSRFWFTRGFIREGRERLAAALARITGGEEPRAGATGTLASTDAPTAGGIDPGLWAQALDGLANLAVAQSDFETARALYEQRLAISEHQGDLPGILVTLINLGVVAFCEGSLAVARSYHERSLTLAQELDDRGQTAASLSGLGGIAELEGDYARASSYFEQCVPLAREVRARGCLAWALHAWGFVTAKQGDLDTGRARLEESLALFQEMGHRYGLARSLERLAGLALAQGQTERAARLYSAAASLREAIGSPLGPLGQAELDEDVAAIRKALGETSFARAWTEGAALTLEQALRYATGPEEPPTV